MVCGSAMIAFGLIPPLCRLAVDEDITLTAWPVVRDAAFYTVGLCALLGVIMTGDPGVISPLVCYGMLVYYGAYLGVVWYTRDVDAICAEDSSAEATDKDAKASTSTPTTAAVVVTREDDDEATPLTATAADATAVAVATVGAGADEDDEEEEVSWWYGAIGKSFFGTMFEWTMPEVPEDSEPSTLTTAYATVVAFVWLGVMSEV